MRRRFALALIALSLFAAVPLIAQETGPQSSEAEKNGFVRFVEDRLSSPERQIRLSNIDGVLSSQVGINEITVSDQQGVWLSIKNASLDWNQSALLLGRLEVRSLSAERIDYLRNPMPVEGAANLPPPEAGGISVPELPVAVILKQLSVPDVTFGESVFGLGSAIAISGRVQLEGGSLDTALAIKRLDGPGGTLDLAVKYTKGDGSVDVGLALTEPPDGIIANLLNIENRPEMRLSLAGKGPISNLVATMTLDAAGQRALGGQAVIKETAAGYAVSADLAGPVSTLMAPAYRAFFGTETALRAEALLRSGGGMTISALNLSGGQLALTASAETTSDNFLSALNLKARIVDAAGTPVVLPVPGADTKLGSADISVDFGGNGSENWSASFAAKDFVTTDITATDFTLTGGGVAANLGDPAQRRITFNGDGLLSGVRSANSDVAAVLGSSLGFGIAGLWNAGEPVTLAELRMEGKALSLAASGQIADAVFDGGVAIKAASLSPFSGIAGRALTGGIDLTAKGTISPLVGGFNLGFDGTGTDLAIGEALLDPLLAGTMRLTGRVARTELGLEAEQFQLANAQVKIVADGRFASSSADFVFRTDLTDLALISPQAQGAVSVVGTASGADGRLALRLDANLPAGSLAGKTVSEGVVNFSGTLADATLTGDLTGSAALAGQPVRLTSAIAVTGGESRLTGLDFEAAGTRLTGAVTRSESGLLNGRLDLQSSDISTAAALALVEARGAANAAVVLEANNGVQGAGISASLRNLVAGDVRVDSADLKLSIADLFGTPIADGTVNAKTLSAAGLDIASLSINATRRGDASSFEGKASLTGGSTIQPFGIAPLALSANGNFADNTVTLANFTASGASGLSIAGSGRVPLSGSGLDLTLEGSAPLQLANRFVADRGGQASGTLSIAARVTGTLDRPSLTGEVSTAGAQYVDPALNLRLINITGNAALTPERMTINRLSAELSTGGSVSASGSLAYADPGLPADLRINLNSARYADGNLVVATVSGDLALTGPITDGGLLSGNLLIEKADITVPDRIGGGAALIDVDHVAIPAPVAQTLKRGQTDQRTQRAGGSSSSLRLDVAVNAPNQIFVRGRGLDVELGGTVRLTGSLSDVNPVGGFELNRGRLAILGQRVTFDSGTVTLIGNMDPMLNFVARTEGEDLTVFITVSGPVSDLSVDFTSSPALPQDEVLSRLLFKRGIGDLSPLQLARLAGAAAELAGGSNSSLLDSLRNATGLDDFELITDEKGNAAVKAGSYINDNIYLGVQAGANGQSRVSIDLDLTPDITARGSAGSDGSTSLGVFYEKDY